jgi:hypothetical protein
MRASSCPKLMPPRALAYTIAYRPCAPRPECSLTRQFWGVAQMQMQQANNASMPGLPGANMPHLHLDMLHNNAVDMPAVNTPAAPLNTPMPVAAPASSPPPSLGGVVSPPDRCAYKKGESERG